MKSVVCAAERVMLFPRLIVPPLPAPSLRICRVAEPRLIGLAAGSELLPWNCKVPLLRVVAPLYVLDAAEIQRAGTILVRPPPPLNAPEYVVLRPLLPTERVTACPAVLARTKLPPLTRPPKVTAVCEPKLTLPLPLVSRLLSCRAEALPIRVPPLTSVLPV